ncbi:MAG TPA: thiolase family protein [Candidatus Acidoferrum sp.]|nr:thiolase family protein [Candidatus Acidoferrum sp.]
MPSKSSDSARDVVIIEAVRSAVGRASKGALRNTRPDELAGQVIRALMARVPAVEPAMVEDVVLGCAMPEGEQGLNVARLAALLGGLPVETSGVTVNRFCSSGLQAIAMAAGAVALGQHDIVLAGGVESMSMVPMTGFHLSASPELMEKMPTAHTPMGITAENLASRFSISRREADEFALASQKKASAAIAAGRFAEEIVPVQAVEYGTGGREPRTFQTDELPRPDTTIEGLSSLKPAFAAKGVVTAGNASPLSDGAAAALVTTRGRATELGLQPRAVFRAYTTTGVDPAIMGIGPIPAVKKLLARTGLTMRDIDLVELNEAFACQALHVQRQLEIPDDRLNVNGGAIALGHPLGCTGAKLTATALSELRRRGGRRAIVTMCIGGGQGAAGLFEALA